MLRYLTAGESHGRALVVIVEGLPAGLPVTVEDIQTQLSRRRLGYGRGPRMRFEADEVSLLAGVRHGRTLGSPVAIQIDNSEWGRSDKWHAEMSPAPGATAAPLTAPRPGHADLAGSVKWLTTDCRETLERASARETASRTAAGAIARCLLRELGIELFGFVRQILDARTEVTVTPANWRGLIAARDVSDTYTLDEPTTERQRAIIRQAKIDKDTVGGHVECHVFGCPPGLGSSMDWTAKLDARIAYAVMGIQAFKAVQIGAGAHSGEVVGSALHDPITYNASTAHTNTLGFERPTNNAGGTEGGMTNGQPVVVTGTMKPIATLLRGLPSIDLNTKKADDSQYERSDVCAISAASVVMENVVGFEVARMAVDKFGGDTMLELVGSWQRYIDLARALPLDGDMPDPRTDPASVRLASQG